MRRVLWGIVLAGLSSGSAQAKTYFATFEMPLRGGSSGAPIVGATHLSVTLASSTPFVKGGCTTSFTLWNFNDAVDTPQTLVVGRGYTNFSNDTGNTLCRDASGNVTQFSIEFEYDNQKTGLNQADFYVGAGYPGEGGNYAVVEFQSDGNKVGENISVTPEVWHFTSH